MYNYTWVISMPLAYDLRPKSIDDIIGQDHLVGKNGVIRKLLKNKGCLAIVHRPERFMDIVIEMKNNGIEPKKVRFVYPGIEKEANILLIEGVKNGKPGLKILSPLYSHEENGDYTEQIQKYFKGW